MTYFRSDNNKINVPSNFVTQGLCRDDGDFLAYSFVGVKIQSQSSVVFLDDNSGSFLDSLRPDTTLNHKSYS